MELNSGMSPVRGQLHGMWLRFPIQSKLLSALSFTVAFQRSPFSWVAAGVQRSRLFCCVLCMMRQSSEGDSYSAHLNAMLSTVVATLSSTQEVLLFVIPKT